MDFTLSPEHRRVQEKARAAAGELAGEAARLEREGRFPQDILSRYAREGFFGVALPREHGGGGLDYVSYALLQMELAQACPSSSLLVHVNHSLFGMGLARFGSEEQQRRYLPPAATGEVLTCFALTEPEAGSDPGGLRTAAEKRGEGWALTGVKNFVTAGDRARFGLVAAATDPSLGAKGLSLFLVDLEQDGNLKRGAVEEKMGLKGAVSVSLHFEGTELPPDRLLGGLNQGLKVALALLDGARVGAAAQAVGLGRAALGHAVRYAKGRRQFGQPIAQFQAVQFKLADMATELEAAALLTLKAAWLRDQGRPYGAAAAMAKQYATDAAMRAASEAVQILGGYGYLTDYPVERLFRAAKAGQIYEGTNEIMRLIIAREVLKG
ncbi:MAG: acyl-CoA dehydrogenase [Deltaproteobacteria bacterium]|nr:acyl-CoA dehydrogenase [Deltaproteobacteria bacterium]